MSNKNVVCMLSYDYADGKYNGTAKVKTSDGMNVSVSSEDFENLDDFAEDLYGKLINSVKKAKDEDKKKELAAKKNELLTRLEESVDAYKKLQSETDKLREDIAALTKEIKSLS